MNLELTAVQWYSLGLLLFRVIAVVFFILLLRKQWKFLKEDDGVQTTRKMLFFLGILLLMQNIIPIIVDILALTEQYARNVPLNLGIVYAFNNAIFSALSAFTFWLMYRFIERENIKLKKENKGLHSENDDYQAADEAREKARRPKNS